MMKFPRILFFIAGVKPTAEDVKAARQLGPNCVFRNASVVPSDGALEQCDGVAGKVPTRYAEKFPEAEEAISAWMEAQREGDGASVEGEDVPTPAPVVEKPATAPEAAPKPAKQPVAWKPN